mmetsp:Transcript_64525/g.124412  ORF Transcript_64525/g.124412 Transcript_64525/m.124412 type:complete len:218 (+) Transcript_64525:717-1370(+)
MVPPGFHRSRHCLHKRLLRHGVETSATAVREELEDFCHIDVARALPLCAAVLLSQVPGEGGEDARQELLVLARRRIILRGKPAEQLLQGLGIGFLRGLLRGLLFGHWRLRGRRRTQVIAQFLEGRVQITVWAAPCFRSSIPIGKYAPAFRERLCFASLFRAITFLGGIHASRSVLGLPPLVTIPDLFSDLWGELARTVHILAPILPKSRKVLQSSRV